MARLVILCREGISFETAKPNDKMFYMEKLLVVPIFQI